MKVTREIKHVDGTLEHWHAVVHEGLPFYLFVMRDLKGAWRPTGYQVDGGVPLPLLLGEGYATESEALEAGKAAAWDEMDEFN